MNKKKLDTICDDDDYDDTSFFSFSYIFFNDNDRFQGWPILMVS